MEHGNLKQTRGRQNGGTLSLHDIVGVSEGIRAVEAAARGVNLAALNAMLSSRRSGDRAVGFRVAAAELRQVAVGLMDAMNVLTDLVSRLVGEVAEQQRQSRVRRYLQCAARQEENAALCLETTLAGGKASQERRERGISQGWQGLSRQVVQARRQCGLGLTLSRNTLIEAAYGGEQAALLKQTAVHLADAIQAISSSLEVLHRQLTGECS